MSLPPPWRDWVGAAVPAPEPNRQLAITRGVALVAAAATVCYLIWRTLVTLTPASFLLGVPLLVMETWAFLTAILYAFVLWDLDALTPPTPRESTELRTVVLIPTYNEPPEVLLPTITAAAAIDLVAAVWVLDDGRRGWVADACASLGLVYRTRPDGTHAKAGNLNAALADVDADLVLVLDADHVASSSFVRNTVGYFDDPKVALVQTPQDFYNEDSFVHEIVGNRRYCEEELFYRAMQAGRNRWNAGFWCGTGAVLRVSALRSVGGVSTDSITEDIHTTIRLHRAGWSTAYHNEVLARGLAASDADQYLVQRLRWGSGAMQVLRKERFLTGSGLTMAQRASYLSTLLGWFDSWRVLGLLLLPATALVLATSPISAPWGAFVTIFGVTFLVQRWALVRLARGRAPLWSSTIFDMVRLPATLRATLSIFSARPLAFTVTDKGRQGQARARANAPRLLTGVAAVMTAAFGWFVASAAGWTPAHYVLNPMELLSCAWLLGNLVLVLAAIRRIRAVRFASERRGAVRLDVSGVADLDGVRVQLTDFSVGGAKVFGPLLPPVRYQTEFAVGESRLTAVVLDVYPSGDGMVAKLAFLPGQEMAATAVTAALIAGEPGRAYAAVAP
jgi:cellulose synthase/poly-beta-1,6-N-acetylglucosamine synthase-like glycosyltransferase